MHTCIKGSDVLQFKAARKSLSETWHSNIKASSLSNKKNWKAVDGRTGVAGKNPNFTRVSASLWQLQKQIFTFRCEPVHECSKKLTTIHANTTLPMPPMQVTCR